MRGIPSRVTLALGCAGAWLGLLLAASPAAALRPVVDTFDVYVTYPDYPIQIPIGAMDPDGGAVTFSSSTLPAGSMLDSQSGLFEWMPTAADIGAYVVQVIVTDDQMETSFTLLSFRVLALDTCNAPICDPATGCTPTLPPIPPSGGATCCVDEPTQRVAEPFALCPGGRVLHMGRNKLGFGRLQNCDRLKIDPLPQGFGAQLRVHFEARCFELPGSTLSLRMTTVDFVPNLVLIDVTRSNQELNWVARPTDDFTQAFNPIYSIVFDPLQFEGSEVEVAITLTDGDGVVTEERLRLTLTLEDLADLPNADIEDVPADEASCVGCHRPLDPFSNEREGIEHAHPWPSESALGCVDCHGGDGTASTRGDAHVSEGAGPAFIKNLTSDQLDQVPLDYVRFVNPGDYRVVAQTCGQSGCHETIAANAPYSVMSTYVGHYALPRYLAGSQGRDPIYGAVDVTDPNYDGTPGTIETLEALREVAPGADRSELGSVIDTYLPKACPTCHMNDFGRNLAAGTYRSSGCTACHMVYSDDGFSQSADPVNKSFLVPHPAKHELTTAIPVEQCGHCHFQGGRIGLHYRGIREGGFAPAKTPPNGVTLGEDRYGHDAGYYFVDEDDTNGFDETPPDLHFSAGMVCADCHVGGDVHGDGKMYRSERYQVGIRCEDCHGTVRQAIQEDPVDGEFKNSRGDALKRLSRHSSGAILLDLVNDPGQLYVEQIKDLLDSGRNPAMNEAMGVNAGGFSHTDSLECYACHTSWRQNCFGCHVTVDDSLSQKNQTTGLSSPGAFSGARDDFSIDFYALGMNDRGKLSPLCSSMSIFVSYVDDTGQTQYTDRVRTSYEGRRGFGWNPFHHHTVSRRPMPCSTCHPVAGGGAGGSDPPNLATLDATYGFGTGEILVTDGDGVEHDVTRFLDDDGNLISEFPHPNTGPVPASVRARAMSVQLPEPLLPLLQAGALAVLAAVSSRSSSRTRARSRSERRQQG